MEYIVICKYRDFAGSGFFSMNAGVGVSWGIGKDTLRFVTRKAAQAFTDIQNDKESIENYKNKWEVTEL